MELENLNLKEVCINCKGTGEYGNDPYDRKCFMCCGYGYKPTQIGKEILSLVEDKFGDLLREFIKL
jgi:hypothetical protein